MKLVVDASAALASVTFQESTAAVVDVFSRSSLSVAPQLYVCEVTTGLWKYVIAKEMAASEAARRLHLALSVIDRYEPEADFAEEALLEAAARRHSAYDLFYLVLARREGASIVTVDARLRKLARAMGVAVLP